jgi:hypothetical protein
VKRPVLTPVIFLRHDFAQPELCAFREGGLNTTWVGKGVVTYGPPAISSNAIGPQERKNSWAQTLCTQQDDGTIKTEIMFGLENGGALPSNFGSDQRSRPAMAAASWFMGCTKRDDPQWPAIWDLAPHLLTPYPYLASEGMPLAFTQEGNHSPVPQVRTLAATAKLDHSMQPWFVIGWDAMSSHEKLRARATFNHSIRLHARVNMWDTVYEIAEPLMVP